MHTPEGGNGGDRLVAVARSVAALRRDPHVTAEQVSQALRGEIAEVLAEGPAGWCRVRLLHDGYEGWIDATALDTPPAGTENLVAVPRTLLFPRADIKSTPAQPLYMGTPVRVEGRCGDLCEVRVAGGRGFVPAAHLRPAGEAATDAAMVALSLLHAPYLWGGRTVAGVDCSGLVQLALRMTGRRNVPRDSGEQMRTVGEPLEPGVLAGGGLARGDLVFWRGHVAMALDPERIIHANAHHMMVAVEPLETAMARIAAAGGEVLALRRP